MLKKEIGYGKYSTIREALNRETGELVAVKCVKRADLPEEAEISLCREIEILQKVDHPNIIKLQAVFSEPHFTYIVMECLTGGELFDGIVKKKVFPEAECRTTMRQLLSALAYLHSNHIIHRGLKPEKILLSMPYRDAVLKLCGFGDACFDTPESESDVEVSCGAVESVDTSSSPQPKNGLSLRSLSGHKTILGTLGYASPEMLSGLPYGNKVDVWSAGIIMYILLCGYPPFVDDKCKTLERRIKSGAIVFHEKYWSKVSDNAKNLVLAMLNTSADDRISSEDALHHPWFSN